MFKWRGEKKKIKVVFKLQFTATQVPYSESEMIVCLVPIDIGRSSERSQKVSVINGACHWNTPVYEPVNLAIDPKSGKFSDKAYQFIVSTTGSNKAGILGGVTVNLAHYAEAFKPCIVSLPLKPSNTGAILHVTLQRMPNDGDGRESGEFDDTAYQKQRKTLQSQLSKIDNHENEGHDGDRDRIDFLEAQVKFTPSRYYPPTPNSIGNLQKSQSSDSLSARSSDTSSGAYTPRENVVKQKTSKQSISFQSPLAHGSSPLKPTVSSDDWSSASAHDESTDDSTNSLDDPGSAERIQDSDDSVDKLRSDVALLTRKAELSDVELQTLRKQIVKESKRGQDLLKEIGKLKEERDELKRQCGELKSDEKTKGINEAVGSNLHLFEKLNLEREINGSLRFQLQKTQEANSELLLAVRDLEELLQKRNGGTICNKCSYKNLHNVELDCDNEERFALGELAKKRGDTETGYSMEKRAVELSNDIEMYRKDREELEMQMEQLALDYEILKQENHSISSKLEQTQLREQLRMQYECSAHLSVISDLEAHVESLEKEIEQRNEAFEADLDKILKEKVEQEKRAIRAEEALSEIKQSGLRTAYELQEEVAKLSNDVLSTCLWNEKSVVQAMKQVKELRSRKNQLEKLLDKRNEELRVVRGQYDKQFRQLFSLLGVKLKETDRLGLELNDKKEELDKYRISGESRLKASLQDVELLRSEVEKLREEKQSLSEDIMQKEKLVNEVEEFKLTNREKDVLLHDKVLEIEELKKESRMLRERIHKLLEVINDMKNGHGGKDDVIKMLRSEIGALRRKQRDYEQCLSEEKFHAKRNKDDYLTTTNKQITTEDGDIMSDTIDICQEKNTSCFDTMNETAELKERNKLMEAELKEMQERYSEISLKFAQVEGERQQLVMKIRRRLY